jgi:hypothetical protein
MKPWVLEFLHNGRIDLVSMTMMFFFNHVSLAPSRIVSPILSWANLRGLSADPP